METRRQTPAFKKTQLLPKVSDAFCFCKCIHICIYFISLFLYLKYLKFEAFVFFLFDCFVIAPRPTLPDTGKIVDCILLVTPVGFLHSLTFLGAVSESGNSSASQNLKQNNRLKCRENTKISERRHRER